MTARMRPLASLSRHLRRKVLTNHNINNLRHSNPRLRIRPDQLLSMSSKAHTTTHNAISNLRLKYRPSNRDTPQPQTSLLRYPFNLTKCYYNKCPRHSKWVNFQHPRQHLATFPRNRSTG